jgi:uncharacterized protein YdhG (YjbR/CyaY superfamily)
MKAMLQMQKIDIKKLNAAYAGKWYFRVLFNKWRCHVERSETSLFIHAAAIDPEMIRASSLRSEWHYETAFMVLVKQKPATIDEYLARVSPDQRALLQKLRETIHTVAPKAEECISYGIPAFRLNGRSLVFFGAWANHCSFYPGSSTTLKKFRDDLKSFQITKGTIRFSPDNPLPPALVKKLVKARIAENRS